MATLISPRIGNKIRNRGVLKLKIGLKTCFNHSISIYSPISMKLIFIFIFYFNLNVNLTVKINFGINFDPRAWKAPVP
jgi:hypothetical protein